MGGFLYAMPVTDTYIDSKRKYYPLVKKQGIETAE
jgi:hypothetical protein